MALYETPSRIWRRIEDEKEPSSLPSLPAFEHSVVPDTESDHTTTTDDDDLLPVHSTPAPISSNNATIRLQSSTSSTVRFATSIASRSASVKSSASRSFGRFPQQSFDVSAITSLPHGSEENTDPEDPPEKSTNSVPEAYLPPSESDAAEDMSLVDALESVSRASSPLSPELPPPPPEPTPKKKDLYDYSVSLRSEPQPSPVSKFRNVALRRPFTRTRTPSLSRSTSSSASSPPNSTPRSNRSIALPRDTESPIPGIHIPLPRSASASPAVPSLPSVVIQPPDDGFSQTSNEDQDATHEREEQFESEAERVSHTEDSRTSDREPTFSSASSDPSYPMDRTIQAARSPAVSSTTFSSPAPSAAFTPTPAVAPRPRPRFNIPPPSQDPQEPDTQEEIETDTEPVTPHTRRRSFLLSIINSTARPRMRFAPTPHPRPRMSELPITNEEVEDGDATPGPVIHKAFAGVTPRPRRGRMSHPLAQTYMPDGEVSETGDGDNAAPSDDAGERASVISTTSSQDLVAHVRANTSYDPALGLGERGKMGRFDAQKLNSYLHGLNRRLQEENMELAARLQVYEEVKQGPRLSVDGTGKGRRMSAVSALGDVEEESGAEGWSEERAELETLIQKMSEDLEQAAAEKDQVSKDLEKERNERVRDKERWRARMAEVEQGVSDIVAELERRVEEAEERHADAIDEIGKVKQEADRVQEHVEMERDLALERAENAESALESGKELGGALKDANAKVSLLSSDLQVVTSQAKELEQESTMLQHKVGILEKELKEEKLSNKLAEEDFHTQLNEMGTEVMQTTARVSELQRELVERDTDLDRLEGELQLKSDSLVELQRCAAQGDKETAEEIRLLKSYIVELEESSAECVKDLQDQLARAQDRVDQFEVEEEHANERMERLEKEAERAGELARQMEEALEAAEERMRSDEEKMADLRSKVTTLEREQERQRDLAAANVPSHHEAEEALEAELDEANREIARLTAVLQQSPARRAIDKAKDTRIEALEREKEELLERVRALKSSHAETTPHRVVNASGISPIHRHVLSMSLKTPKTPGAPLRDLSWLNATTAGDPTASPLLAEIARLQTELDHANNSIDQKLDELQEAGLGVVDLTRNLEDARSKIISLENENARLQRREERRLRRLEKIRCQKCFVKIDLLKLHKAYEADESSLSVDITAGDLLVNPPTPLIKTSEALRVELQNVHAQLDTMKNQWQDEKRQLLGEKAVLQDAANRMHIEVRNAKQEARKAVEAERESRRSRADTQGEADKARTVIADLEAELQAERMRLRKMSAEQDRLQREIGEVSRQLQRTETDMDDVKYQLQKAKEDNHELGTELRANASAEQKTRVLEAKVRANTSTIERLRQERSVLARDHKDLQQQYTQVSERAHKLRSDYSASQKSHENRRQQLDIHLAEIEELRNALSDQAEELQRTEQEKNRMAMEKTDIARTIAVLEAELKRVRKDAEIFGRDLKALRAEKEKAQERQREEVTKAERAKKQTQTQIRLLTDQLENQKARTKRLQQHVCPTADDGQLSELRAQHKQECKGLIVQIRYLKAKFTRESTLRDDLCYQKQYLLVLLASFEASDNRILACISRIGYPKPSPPIMAKKRRTFKSAAWGIVFIRRARLASDVWREACANKQAIADALQEVRRHRTTIEHR